MGTLCDESTAKPKGGPFVTETMAKHKEGPVVTETTAKPKGGPLTYCNGPPFTVHKGLPLPSTRIPLDHSQGSSLAIHKGPPLVGKDDQTQGGTLCDETTAKPKGGPFVTETTAKHKEGPVVTETTAKPKGGSLTYCNGPPLSFHKDLTLPSTRIPLGHSQGSPIGHSQGSPLGWKGQPNPKRDSL